MLLVVNGLVLNYHWKGFRNIDVGDKVEPRSTH